MNVPVTLAGFPASWRFRDSARLDAWLAQCPWNRQGGVCVVRITSPELAEPMARALRQAVRGHDDGERDVGVPIIEASHGDLRSILQTHLDLQPGPDHRAYLRAAAGALSAWPSVLVLPAVEAKGGHPKLYADAQELVQKLPALESNARATLILIDTQATAVTQATSPNVFDLTVGGMADPVLGDLERNEQDLWRAYVHARLAWETAGDLRRALDWNERGFRSVSVGGDHFVENLLNQCAEVGWKTLDEATIQQTTETLQRIVAPRKGSSTLSNSSPVPSVFWRPPGETQARPMPWVARSFLRHGLCPEAGFFLRGCLICAPLAREILSHCFDLESRQRAIGWANRGTFRPPSEAEERFRKFQEKQLGSGAEFYPKDCPAMPVDGWAFTVFGEFIASLPLDRQQLIMHHDLRNLRNALAHGHYIGWQMVTTLRRIERQFA